MIEFVAALARDGYWEVPDGKLAAIVTFLEMREPLGRRPAPDRPAAGGPA